MDNRDIPKIISQLRSKLDISQENLAKKLGVSFSTLNRWENGRISPRSGAKKSILKLIEETELDAEQLIEEPGVSTPKMKRKIKSKEDVLSTKSMEQMLWSAACSIRGEKDAPKFKDYILPLVFIKRLSDVFDDEISRLSEKYGDK